MNDKHWCPVMLSGAANRHLTLIHLFDNELAALRDICAGRNGVGIAMVAKLKEKAVLEDNGQPTDLARAHVKQFSEVKK